MKVSLWQQFSSNHSASFTVVGQFESNDRAKFAADALEVILRKLSLWWEHLTRDERMFWNERAETSLLTPPELELRRHYKIEWPFNLTSYCWKQDEEINPVSIFSSLVFIRNLHWSIHKGPQPFDTLMALFGGDVHVETDESTSYPDTTLLVHLTCTAPDETVAKSIVDKTTQYIEGLIGNFKDALRTQTARRYTRIPWLVYHGGILDERADEIKLIEEQVVEDRDFIDWKERQWVLDALINTDMEINFLRDYPKLEASAQREGVALSLNNLCFSEWVIGLRALSAWLIDEGCTDITYRFSSHSGKPPLERGKL